MTSLADFRQAVASFSRGRIWAERRERIESALWGFCSLLPERLGSEYANIDDLGRIRIRVPWKDYGGWHLTSAEAKTLAKFVKRWAEEGDPMMSYDKSSKTWVFDYVRYPSERHVEAWLDAHRIATSDVKSAWPSPGPKVGRKSHKSAARSGEQGVQRKRHTGDAVR